MEGHLFAQLLGLQDSGTTVTYAPTEGKDCSYLCQRSKFLEEVFRTAYNNTRLVNSETLERSARLMNSETFEHST